MKKSSTTSLVTAVLLALLLAVPGAAFASQSTSTTMPLGLAGTFVNVGYQHYTVSGGQLQILLVNGAPVTMTNPRMQYTIDATVRGLSVRGEAQFDIFGFTSSGDFRVSGDFQLNGMLPAIGLPLDPSQLTLASPNLLACLVPGDVAYPCTSEIPAFFVGSGTLSVSQGHQTTNSQVTMWFESPYLNPFGMPITMISSDLTTIAIAATYTGAISNWSGVQVGGAIYDVNNNLVGAFTQTSSLVENLVSGNENDQGTNQLTFSFPSSGSYTNLDGQYTGSFSGTSTIPTSGEYDCSSTGPFLPGTCTATGSMSQGSFHHLRSDSRITISGTYSIQWSIPAVGFSGTVLATFRSQ